MANTYKNIIITPNIGNTADPKIQFLGGNTTANTDINLFVYPSSNGTLSFEGSAGQLFSITNDLSGSLFSINDVSGIPSIEVFANGLISVSGNVSVSGTLTSNLAALNNITANNFSGFGIGFGSNLQILTSGTSWAVPAGVLRWKVTVQGGGGQGGGSTNIAGHVGNGGGSGATVIGFYNFVAGQTAMTYNIGAGGSGGAAGAQGTSGGASNTTYNGVVYNAGGGGGGNTSATVNGGGTAGTGTGGRWNFTGNRGISGGVAAATNPVVGLGAHTNLGLGDGGGHPGTAAGEDGNTADGYGAGGSGGKSGSGITARAGGNGTQGVIIVEW